ncbi:MAG: hypothetical protein MPK05_03240 [Gammaproteobacteria bacterium]|nr:hypothetical protein [Gammaproteobacteria bacterium]
MAATEKPSTVRFAKAVALLKQDIDDLENALQQAGVPVFAEIASLEEIPKAKRKDIENRLWLILAYGEYPVEKLWSEMWSSLDMLLSIAKSDWPIRFYATKYKKEFRQKIKRILGAENAPSRTHVELWIVKQEVAPMVFPLQSFIDEVDINDYVHMARNGILLDECIKPYINAPSQHAREDASIFESFRKIGSVAGDYYLLLVDKDHEGKLASDYREPRTYFGKDGPIEGEVEYDKKWIGLLQYDLSSFDEIIHKRYFTPDAWVQNESKLLPIAITEEEKKIRPHIRERLHEIYHAFIFSNWIAVVALSRCLLEYALVDKEDLLKINAYEKNQRVKRLSCLIADAKKTRPKLGGFMARIKDAGDAVMHPQKDSRLPDKEAARNCITDITKIVSALYSE